MPLTTHTEEDELITGINVTPLVDVAFVVLIIFIVTASMVLKDNIPVKLPEAKSAEDVGQGLINIAITEQGKLFINGSPATLEALPAAIVQAKARAK